MLILLLLLKKIILITILIVIGFVIFVPVVGVVVVVVVVVLTIPYCHDDYFFHYETLIYTMFALTAERTLEKTKKNWVRHGDVGAPIDSLLVFVNGTGFAVAFFSVQLRACFCIAFTSVHTLPTLNFAIFLLYPP